MDIISDEELLINVGITLGQLGKMRCFTFIFEERTCTSSHASFNDWDIASCISLFNRWLCNKGLPLRILLFLCLLLMSCN